MRPGAAGIGRQRRSTLNPAQAQLVRELATSGPASSSRSPRPGPARPPPCASCASAWTDSGGTVLGLAPSAAAAAVLREEIGTDTDTLAKLVWHLTASRDQRLAAGVDDTDRPGHPGHHRRGRMAGTPDLAAAIDYVTGRGGSVRLVGDDQQLAAIGAGGVLRDIAATARRGHPVAGHALHRPHQAHPTTPKAPPPSPCATATRPRSASTSTTAASTSAT